MCRYAFTDYKSHFACFECRKAFKKTSITDWVKQNGFDYSYSELLRVGNSKNRKPIEEGMGITLESIRNEYMNDVSACPECGVAMAAMGFDFKAPKQQSEEEWRIIHLLYDNGFAFRGCGCSVGYAPPKSIGGLKQFFHTHGRLSDGEKLLGKIAATKARDGGG